MLLQFSVSNFRSFKDEQFITMIPAKIKGHEENIAYVEPGLDVLRSAVIYGANASGKSNFVKAIRALINLVKTSSDKKPGENFSEYEPFKLSSSSQKKPVGFSIDFLIQNIRYHYELQIFEERVAMEKLTFFPQGREAKLFERKEQNFSFGEYFKGPKKYLEQLTAANQLFLSKGAVNNVEKLVNVFQYFESKWKAIAPDVFIDTFEKELSQMTAYMLMNSSELSKRIVRLFQLLDTGVEDFIVKDLNPELDFYLKKDGKITNLQTSKYKVNTIHFLNAQKRKKEVTFDLEDESTGTQKLFWMIGLILNVLEAGGIFILDELERSLHPHISRFIMSLFNNPKINKNNAQLIAATHDVTLLSEENKLRRDQIWIVEKNEQGASELFSLADMKGVRDNLPFEKWYLSGRFGGVPNIESLQFEFDYLDEKKENKTNGKKD